MADYNKMLIDLLNEKILRLNIENDSKRKEINRLKKRIRELEKLNDKHTQETHYPIICEICYKQRGCKGCRGRTTRFYCLL